MKVSEQARDSFAFSKDLCRLGAPFLLSKAANAAAAFESQQDSTSATTFANACAELQVLLSHSAFATLAVQPGLAGSSCSRPVESMPTWQPLQSCDRELQQDRSEPGGLAEGGDITNSKAEPTAVTLSPARSDGFGTPESSSSASMVSATSQHMSAAQDLSGNLSDSAESSDPNCLTVTFAGLGFTESVSEALRTDPVHESAQKLAGIVESYMPDDSPEPALCFNAWEAASVGLTPDRCSNLGAAGTLLDRTLPEVVATGRSPTRLQANGVTSAAQEAAASVDDSAEQQDQGWGMPDFSSPASSIPQLSPDASPCTADEAIDAAAASQRASAARDGSDLRGVGVTPGDPDSPGVAPQSAARRQLFQSDSGNKADGHRATPHRDAASCSRAGSREEWQSPKSQRLGSESPEAKADASESEGSPPIVAQSTIRKGRKPAFEEPSPAMASPSPLRESTTFKTPGPGRASYSAGDISEPSLSPIELSSDSDEEEDLSLLTAHGNQPQIRPQGRRTQSWLSGSEDEESGRAGWKENKEPATPLQPRAPNWHRRPPASVPAKLPPSVQIAGRPPQTPMTTAAFRRQRASLAAKYFAEFNEKAFGGQLPGDLQIKWSAHLQTTAGLAITKREYTEGAKEPRYAARVELSCKVVDRPQKLRNTLLHELCHVATWVINHVSKPPHGTHFKYWAARAMQHFPDCEVKTCHNYDIHYAFRWQCTNNGCKKIYKRHSNSIDTVKKVCGRCQSKLQFLGKFNCDGTPAVKRDPSQFSLFVKQHFSAVKQTFPAGTPNASVMKSLATKWHEQKANANKEASIELSASKGYKSDQEFAF